MNKIFVYGIFIHKSIREQVFNKDVKTYPANLRGYELGLYYGVGQLKSVFKNDDCMVNSMIMEVNNQQLSRVDDIEGIERNFYRRITVNTDRGDAYLYLK